MNIVFDTNVLISAFLTTTGPSQHVLSRALKKHRVVLSEYILNEFTEKLTHKLQISPHQVTHATIYLKKKVLIPEIPTPEKQPAFPDKKDIPILNLIQFVKPHYLITGDKKLLELKKLGATLILSPREAMEIL